MSETILVAEDDLLQRKTITAILAKKLGYKVISVSNGREALDCLQEANTGDINVALLDINMPIMDGFETLKNIRKYYQDIPVLMLTGDEDINSAVRAIKEGASDFIVKPAEPARLDIAIKNSVRLSSLARELAKIKRDKSGALSFVDLIGNNGGLTESISYGRKASASSVPVLLLGETGVGKEIFARAIHGESKRISAPFISVNCSTMPQHIEQILFGDSRNNTTNASNRDIGKIRAADGGTLFLDDVSELSPDAQVRLLRLLQQKEIEPTNGSRPIKVNVRIISATDRNLLRDVQTGRFREDLYFRLNILTINIPPLRERQQDIVPLVEYFMQKICASDSLPIKSLGQDAKQYLIKSYWSGNVRELEGLIHRALVLSDNDIIDRSTIEHIHESNTKTQPLERRATPSLHINMRKADTSFKNITEIENEAMQTALKHFEGNITQAADALGIAKSTFYRKIKE